MAEIFNIGDRAKIKPVDQADNYARAYNATLAMMAAMSSEERLLFLAQLRAAEACEHGGRNACHGTAVKRAAEGFALTMWEICKTFPPPGEEPFL